MKKKITVVLILAPTILTPCERKGDRQTGRNKTKDRHTLREEVHQQLTNSDLWSKDKQRIEMQESRSRVVTKSHAQGRRYL